MSEAYDILELFETDTQQLSEARTLINFIRNIARILVITREEQIGELLSKDEKRKIFLHIKKIFGDGNAKFLNEFEIDPLPPEFGHLPLKIPGELDISTLDANGDSLGHAEHRNILALVKEVYTQHPKLKYLESTLVSWE